VLWVLVTVAVVVGSLAVLGLAGWGTYRRVRGLTAEIGRSSERVAAASVGLNEGLGALQSAGAGQPTGPGTRPPARRTADGEHLAARVQHGRDAARGR
jgi:hypothetical protein